MEVFYVMVLVLVAGAVPSHGRTESEGTVFNKTQSHESMNNVTASNSKWETYGHYHLAMQWPRSFCNSRSMTQIPCYNELVRGLFTVHGLWPQATSGRRIDCTRKGIYGRYPLFNRSQLNPRLVAGLNRYWPDLTSSENNNECFWGTEYNKHGSCIFNNQNAYFDLTLRMIEQLWSPRIRGGQVLVPGSRYSPSDIREAFYKVIRQRPMLKCIRFRNSFQLLEIRFCVDINLNLMSVCNGILDCGNGLIDFPLPGPPRP